MCAIIGALVWGLTTQEKKDSANAMLNHIIAASHERGKDGRGFMWDNGSETITVKDATRRTGQEWEKFDFFSTSLVCGSLIGNLRAEPTTEFISEKKDSDQQPYSAGNWSIVHNGTIANDRELRTNEVPTSIDSAAIVEVLNGWFCGFTALDHVAHFKQAIKRLKGSYAILARNRTQPNHLMVAANYRPVWYAQTENGVFFASAKNYFPSNINPKMVTPYSVASFYAGCTLEIRTETLYDADAIKNKALVVCSGGLDSVVAATYTKKVLGMETELIHFKYGSRAEGPEVEAVQNVAKELGVPCTIFPLPVYKPSDSPLLQADSKIAGGEAGAEFAHEWVPARNLLLLSVATAYAEANGFDAIVLGNNLEEAGAYPDNEPEFIAKFNDLLPFAIASGKRMSVIMPVGNLMKHEIVELGNSIGAPMNKTWSCYRAGELHCGKCGPCYMRRTAFEINGIPEVISYEV